MRYKSITSTLKVELRSTAINEEHEILSSNSLGRFYGHVKSRSSHKSGVAPLKDKDGSIVVDDTAKAILLKDAVVKFGTVDNGMLSNLRDSSTDCTARDYLLRSTFNNDVQEEAHIKLLSWPRQTAASIV